jgi:hypothetical protein
MPARAAAGAGDDSAGLALTGRGRTLVWVRQGAGGPCRFAFNSSVARGQPLFEVVDVARNRGPDGSWAAGEVGRGAGGRGESS